MNASAPALTLNHPAQLIEFAPMLSFKPKTIRARLLWIAFIITIFCTTIYTIHLYLESKAAFLHGIDDTLENTSLAIPDMLPADFHDQIYNNPTKPPPHYAAIVKDIDEYAAQADVEFICTAVEIDGKYYMTFLAGNRMSDNPVDLSRFMQPMGNINNSAGWSTTGITVTTYENEDGAYRSAAYPLRTPGGHVYYSCAEVSLSTIQDKLRSGLHRGLIIGIGIFSFFWIGIYILITVIMNPIGKLASCTSDVFHLSPEQRGELSAMGMQYQDEVGSLAQAFMEMEDRLDRHIKELTALTSAEERRQSEMRIARDIQMDFLASKFPTSDDAQVFATSRPAREVGGDLYTFRELDGHRLFFSIGDVSGKGMSAALLMAKAKVLFDHTSAHTDTPSAILEAVSREIAMHNSSMMFVTAFCAVLDLNTGILTYSNAGHNPPVIIAPDGSPVLLHLPSGLVMGFMPDTRYKEESIQIPRGSTILAYTDGITEAENPDDKLFTEARLLNACVGAARLSASALTEKIFGEIDAFANGAPQSDDITMIAIRFEPEQSGTGSDITTNNT